MFIRVVIFFGLSLAFSGCKVEFSVPQNGRVDSESGAYTCDSGDTCVINVVDAFFDETFQAKPDQGYTFAAWRTKPSSLCGGLSKPCRLTTTAFPGTPFMNFLESDDVFFLEPVFGKKNSWRQRADVITPGVGAGACTLRGKLYFMSTGWGWFGGFGKAEVYDPLTNTWNILTPLPTPRAWVTASAVKDKCYVIGGGSGGGRPAMTTVEVYDPATGSWRASAPLPQGRESAGSAVVNGKLYVIGGGDAIDWASTPRASVAIYDPATNTWSKGADMPTPRKGLGVAAVGGLIYAVGGSNHDLGIFSSGIVERYDPETDRWTSLASMPVERNFLFAAALNGKLYAAGGLIDQGDIFNRGTPTSKTVFSYDPKSNQWTQRADLANARYSPAAAVLDGQIYVVGGRLKQETVAMGVTEEYTP